MNTVRVMGGLGNQMFQYAFGRSLQLQSNTDIQFDKSWYNNNKHPERPFLLNKFNTVLRTTKDGFTSGNYCKEFQGNFMEIPAALDNHYFDGYWQYLNYFTGVIPKLKSELTLRSEYYTDEFLAQLIKIDDDLNSVSLHVRRGDYLLQKGWGVLPLRYYYLALKQVRGNLYIFSDDIEYCKPLFDQGYFADRKVTFIKTEPYLDFELMKACRKHIIANSTFSFWAALLDTKVDSITYCPEYWLGESTPDDGNHYPQNWKRIKM